MTMRSAQHKDIARELAKYLGPVIRKRRLLLKLTQAQLGARVGSMRSIVCRAESGLHVLSLETLERYARALECKPSALMRDAEQLAEDPDPRELPREVAI